MVNVFIRFCLVIKKNLCAEIFFEKKTFNRQRVIKKIPSVTPIDMEDSRMGVTVLIRVQVELIFKSN